MRPSNFHSPGLPAATKGLITKILREWRKSDVGSDKGGRKKK